MRAADAAASRERTVPRLSWRAAGLVLAAAALVTPGAAFAWKAATPRDTVPRATIPVSLGDVAKVTGAPIGCLVRRQSGAQALDCRRAGVLAGSYGTILTKTQVLVVRFESRKVARIVFQARHGKLRVHTCGG
ncbi:MAG TPA: hypothetical protein VF232_12835 [Gaiellaceae bacterium]